MATPSVILADATSLKEGGQVYNRVSVRRYISRVAVVTASPLSLCLLRRHFPYQGNLIDPYGMYVCI